MLSSANDAAKLQLVQRRVLKDNHIPAWSILRGENEERLASLNLFFLNKCWLRSNLIQCFKILKDFMNVDANKLFSTGNSWRSNGEKLRCKQVQLDSIKFFFIYVVKEWIKHTVNALKNKLDHHLLNQGIWKEWITWHTAGCWTTFAADCVNSYFAGIRKLLL